MLMQGEKTRQTSQIPPGLNHFIQEIEKDAKKIGILKGLCQVVGTKLPPSNHSC